MTKQRWIVLSVAAVFLTTAIAILYSQPPTVILADGSAVQYGGISYGTNNYIHGTLLEKAFARWIPDQGLSWGRIRMRKPQPIRLVDSQTWKPALWFYFDSLGDSSVSTISRLLQYRVIAVSEDGTSFPNYFSGAVQRHSGELLARVPLKLYPRTEKKLRFSLETLTASNQWEVLATYTVGNPVRATKPEWEAGATELPQTRVLDALEMVLKRAIVKDPLSGKTNPELEKVGPAMKPLSATYRTFALQFELQPNDGSTSNAVKSWKDWKLHECSASDRFGNVFEFNCAILKPLGQLVNSFTLENPGQVLLNEPHKVKLSIQLTDSDAQMKGSVTFSNLTMHTGSAASAPEHWLTNAFGVPVSAKWSTDGLLVELPEKTTDARLLKAEISCDTNAKRIEKPGSNGRQIVFNETPGPTVNVHVKLVRLAHLEYFVRPALLDK